jgi:hypothetical protein
MECWKCLRDGGSSLHFVALGAGLSSAGPYDQQHMMLLFPTMRAMSSAGLSKLHRASTKPITVNASRAMGTDVRYWTREVVVAK